MPYRVTIAHVYTFVTNDANPEQALDRARRFVIRPRIERVEVLGVEEIHESERQQQAQEDA